MVLQNNIVKLVYNFSLETKQWNINIIVDIVYYNIELLQIHKKKFLLPLFFLFEFIILK